jgi:undecaprenol kinase/diacylglycerol kinase (ATP)
MNNRIVAFKAAFNGIYYALKNEWNLRFHFIVATIIIIIAFFLQFSILEFSVLLLTIGLVISLEMINTSIEELCNYIQPEKHELIKIIKDISAGAVLISSIIALIIGIALFLPKLLS